jgi:sterol desaturase/sphingolipid hydroxylase (fatty acid hydroxylase superfamily)
MAHSAPRAFTRAWFGYWTDFILAPIVAVTVAAIYCRTWEWVGFAALGFLLWTFAEYWTHRALLHRVFWHGIHERHHKRPNEYVVFAIWHTPVFFAACFLIMPTSLFTGFVLGYVWFQLMHHWLHHVELAKHTWLNRYAVWHNRHHKLGDCNYGITVPVWDWLFRTSR